VRYIRVNPLDFIEPMEFLRGGAVCSHGWRRAWCVVRKLRIKMVKVIEIKSMLVYVLTVLALRLFVAA